MVFVTKVIITAVGKGTRLLPFTKEMPKEVMPIYSKSFSNNKLVTPLLQYIFEQLYSMNFRDYCFIIRKEKVLAITLNKNEEEVDVGTTESFRCAQDTAFREA